MTKFKITKVTPEQIIAITDTFSGLHAAGMITTTNSTVTFTSLRRNAAHPELELPWTRDRVVGLLDAACTGRIKPPQQRYWRSLDAVRGKVRIRHDYAFPVK